MPQLNVFENKAFQTNTSKNIGFNLVSQTNNFTSVFDTKPLDALESTKIEKLLVDGFQPGIIAESQVANDLIRLKQLTAEIKAIGKQSAVLMGERVFHARELLKSYKDGTFTRWLESSFGTRKTGYNLLAYYELYTALPHDELRERFKNLHQKTAYALASREGNISKKLEIISEYQNRNHDELMILIKEKLPITSRNKSINKSDNGFLKKLIINFRHNLEKIHQKKDELDIEDKKELNSLNKFLSLLLNEI